jgi:ABC-2 type transport system ATP-binding protein
MPENVPLPADMRVIEYLRFRAALKGVPGRRMKERVTDVCDLCSLGTVTRKLIGALSKGYRQRVGLADAMIHEPELLILDEPTIGLDPNQIRQVRELIKNLRRHHTILLSTHILPEVEMTCSRVLIINKGRIEAMDTPENLRHRLSASGEATLEAKVDNVKAAVSKLRSLAGVKDVFHHKIGEWSRFQLTVEEDPRERIHELAIAENWPLRELSRRGATLEEVFAEVTHAEEH